MAAVKAVPAVRTLSGAATPRGPPSAIRPEMARLLQEVTAAIARPRRR